MSHSFYSHWFSGLNRALAELDEDSINTLAVHCGRACSDSYTKQVYLNAYHTAETLDAFIENLNNVFREAAIWRVNQDTVEVVYTRCACDLVRDGAVRSPALCQCSLKSLQYNWEAVLGKGGAVCTLEESILRGDGRCRFTIRLPANT